MNSIGKHSGKRVGPRRPRGSRGPASGRPKAPRADRPGQGRSALLAVVAVVVLAAAAVCAGTARNPAEQQSPTTRTTATGRDLSCAGGIPGARARIGSVRPHTAGSVVVDGKPLHGSVTKSLGGGPVQAHAGPVAAPWLYGVRSASTGSWSAAAGCPQPGAEWWFVGAGASQRHPSVLTLDNPREGTAVVDVEVLGPDGTVKAPGLQGIQVGSGRSVRLDLTKVAPQVGDLAVHVSAVRGLVAASVAEQWSPAVVVKPSREWVSPQTAAQHSLTLVGIPAKTPHATLLVSNPSSREAVVHLGFVKSSGTFTPSAHQTFTVAPDTVRDVNLDDVLESAPLAVRVSSQVPVNATVRSWSGSDDGYATAPEPLGSQAVAGVPDGATATLQIASTSAHARAGRSTRLQVVGLGAHGKQSGHRIVRLGEAAASTLKLWPHTAAVTVRVLGSPSAGDRVVGALLVRHGNGHTGVVPLSSTSTGTEVPVVRPGW